MKRKPAPARGETPATESVPSKPITVVLIDDNQLLLQGLAGLIRTQPGLKVLAASADVEEALRNVREVKPDVVLLDVGLQDYDSLNFTTTVHDEIPGVKVIIMGLLPVQQDVADYVRAGASGFIVKNTLFEDFIETIRSVAAGTQVLPPILTNSLFSQIARNAVRGHRTHLLETVRLTNRERQVMDLLAEGLSNKEIAKRLQIALHTVKSHVHNVLEKLALRSRLEVAALNHRAASRASS